jgi:excisionase family DNA binding protein
MPKITISRAEAADALSVDIQTIDNMIADGRLRASKLGRRVVIRIVDIEKMLTACEVAE